MVRKGPPLDDWNMVHMRIMDRLLRLASCCTVAAVMTACSVLPNAGPSVGVSTIVAETLQALTPPATASSSAPAGLPIAYGNLRLVIPPELATGTTNTTTADVEFPYTNPSLGPMPEHSKIILNGYPVQGTLFAPQITAFRAGEYSRYGPITQEIVVALQGLHYSAGQPLPSGFPAGVLDAKIQELDFAHGRGVRFLTQFDQAPLPVINHELFYYFQGLTTDGNWYVQAILPVQAPILAADDNPASPLPPGGIPFDTNQLQAYFDAVSAKLNATSPEQFTPSLASLDALIQSIGFSN